MNSPVGVQKPFINPNNNFGGNSQAQTTQTQTVPQVNETKVQTAMKALTFATIKLNKMDEMPENIKQANQSQYDTIRSTLVEGSKKLLKQWAAASQLPYLAQQGVTSTRIKESMLKIAHSELHDYIQTNYPTFGLK